ncbi:MAG TPA: PhoU domain-containing protein, partial [Acidimicrobiales bacterium]|nr:PhoU domain-containing protein [Acidimicrobiales bacterium]
MGRVATDSEAFRQRVDRTVLVLFATVIETTSWATTALLDQDVERAFRIIADDSRVDDRVEELTGLIKERLAENSIDSDELEDLVTILQMAPELERSADLAEHIAQRTRQGLGGNISPLSRGLIQSMCGVCVRMWQLASRAYGERS